MPAQVFDIAANDDDGDLKLQPEAERIGAAGSNSVFEGPVRAAISRSIARGGKEDEEECDGGDLELQALGASRGEEEWQSAEPALVRLYRVWPGRNAFYCWGHLMTGSSREGCGPNITLWALVLVPFSLYFMIVFPSNVHDGFILLPGFTLVIFFVTTGLLLATTCSDPGIIPRRNVVLASHDEERLQTLLGYDFSGSTDDEERRGTVPTELYRAGYRWCATCQIIRPPRSSHCKDCDNCVMRFDHHCPVMNNCIGQRNYHYFFGFITCVMLLAILVLPALFAHFSPPEHRKSSMRRPGRRPVYVKPASTSPGMSVGSYTLIVGGILVVAAIIFAILLWLYHVFLIVTGKTTKEFRRNIANIDQEPTLCAKQGPRLFDPRSLVDARKFPKDFAALSRLGRRRA
jgi:hypothetical protein